MKKPMMRAFFALILMLGLISSYTYAGTWCVGSGASCFTTTSVQINILPGNMCIGSTGTFSFGSFAVSSIAQTVSGAFVWSGGYFYVDDLRGADVWYYTTVQLSADLTGPGTSKLSSGNVYVKTVAIGSAWVTLIAGSANTNVQIQSSMSAFQSLNTARQLIIRNNAANNGTIGQYGVLPQMQLVIPAYQAVGAYTGTLTYTLYTN